MERRVPIWREGLVTEKSVSNREGAFQFGSKLSKLERMFQNGRELLNFKKLLKKEVICCEGNVKKGYTALLDL